MVTLTKTGTGYYVSGANGAGGRSFPAGKAGQQQAQAYYQEQREFEAGIVEGFGPVSIANMREWLMDCDWGDVDASDIASMPASTIIRAIERLYDGGLTGWDRDNA